MSSNHPGLFRLRKSVAQVQLLVAVVLGWSLASHAGAQESDVPRLILPDASGISIGIHPSGVVEVKGVLRSEEEAQPIFAMLRSVRPDLKISVDELTVDETAMAVPALQQVPEFIEELALTTHNWYVSSRSGEFMVLGETDTLVTRAAFQARLNLLRFDDPTLRLRNMICIVSEEDFPDPPRVLPDALSQNKGAYIKVMKRSEREAAERARLENAKLEVGSESFEARSSGVANLELAGLETPDLSSSEAGLLVPDRLDWLFVDVDRDLYRNQMPVARVIPSGKGPQTPASLLELAAEEAGNNALPLAHSFSMRARPDNKPDMKVLGLIPFSDQSFMLQVSQMNELDRFAGELLSPTHAKDEVVLRAHVGGSGTDAFNEWVGSKRVAEVKRMLGDLGVDKSRMRIELKAANGDDKNPHRVDILVPHHNLPEEATASIFRTTGEVNVRAEPVHATPITETPERLETVDAPIKPTLVVPTTGPVVLDVE